MNGSLVGHTTMFSGHMASFTTDILVILMVFLVFIIIELDFPRRGLIEVREDSLVELKVSIEAKNMESKD